jgi:hypothetical protein
MRIVAREGRSSFEWNKLFDSLFDHYGLGASTPRVCSRVPKCLREQCSDIARAVRATLLVLYFSEILDGMTNLGSCAS